MIMIAAKQRTCKGTGYPSIIYQSSKEHLMTALSGAMVLTVVFFLS